MKTILIVDDSKIFQKLLERILSPHFQIVGKGGNGIEGFELYQKLKPDLVLMDITMPNCNGKECLAKIISFDSNAKVIMVSSLGDEQTLSDCIRLGAKAFVKKDDVTATNISGSPIIKTATDVSESSKAVEAA